MTCTFCSSADDPDRTYLIAEFPSTFGIVSRQICSHCLDIIKIAMAAEEK